MGHYIDYRIKANIMRRGEKENCTAELDFVDSFVACPTTTQPWLDLEKVAGQNLKLPHNKTLGRWGKDISSRLGDKLYFSLYFFSFFCI